MTTNLGLDTIETTDSIQNAFLTKMNSNMQKLDNAYGLLKTKLLDVTDKSNINEAIDTFNTMGQQITDLKSIGNATASDIVYGKTALVQGNTITGTYKPNVIPTINVTLSGSYTDYISGYGAGVNKDGVLVIWAMSNSTAYEHVSFTLSSMSTGLAIDDGWDITSYDTADPANVPHACTVTGLSGKSTINITLSAGSVSSSYDYVKLTVTITAS